MSSDRKSALAASKCCADDQVLLDAVPAFISISDMLKATPITEGADRFVYFEASNETTDQQGEVVLAKALADSAAYYLKFGNVDLDHYTQIGAKQGIPNYELYEIGRPIAVRADKGSTFVKAQIYTGMGAAAERANNFWSSLVDLSPPKRWFPSVGGVIQEKEVAIDPATKSKRVIIKKVRWSNVGVSATPVNPNLATVSALPIGALAKSWGPSGFDLTKASQLASDPIAVSAWYRDARDRLADLVLRGKAQLNLYQLTDAAMQQLNLQPERAHELADQFLLDLRTDRRVNDQHAD